MPPKTKEEVLEEYRCSSIEDAAIAVIARRGVDEATIQEIATEAGVAKGTIYVYFTDRDDLLRRTAGRAVDRLIEQLEPALAADVPLEAKLRMLLLRQLEFFDANASLFRASMALSRQEHEPNRRKKKSNAFERYAQRIEVMFAEAVKTHPKGDAIMAPGALVADPVSAISLGLALMFGTAGLPHILMRFFTVSDAQAARKSVFYATGFIAYFYILTFIIGFGAITFLMNDPNFFKLGAGGAYDKVKDILGGTNMAAIHLASATGGSLFLGFISAVAFATILAVVAGLTLSGASAVSHDLYAEVIARGRVSEQKEVRISKISAIVIGIVAIILGYIFENQNVAFMVGLAFAVAASCNFPVLLMSVLWKGTTTRGALIGGLLGLVSAVSMVVLSKAVWVQTFGFARELFPYDNPAIFSMPIAFLGIWLISKLDASSRAKAEIASFDAQYIRSETGIGAAAAHVH